MTRNTLKSTRSGLRLPALLLAATLLLSGCVGGKPGDPATPDPPGSQDAIYTVGDYDMVEFDKMPYHRPDMTALELLFNDTADFAASASAGDGAELNAKLALCWNAYDEYYTMEALAMLRSDIDQTDE